MTKIRTLEQLQQNLDDELAWRKKELLLVKSLVTARSSSTDTISCHVRSGVALIYAHWEGFIKAAGSAYLVYIASQRLTYHELASNFLAVSAKRLLSDAHASNKMGLYTKLTDFFLLRLSERCILPTEIETKSNLSSEVLKDILYTLGLDYEPYAIKAKLIDEMLLRNRNEIAHGKFLLITPEEFIDLHTKIVNLMDLFSNQISNAAITRAYKRTVISNSP